MYIETKSVENYMYEYSGYNGFNVQFGIKIDYYINWNPDTQKYKYTFYTSPQCRPYSKGGHNTNDDDWVKYILSFQFWQDSQYKETKTSGIIEKSLQGVAGWNGDHNWWHDMQESDKFKFEFESEKLGNISIHMRFTSFGVELKKNVFHVDYKTRGEIECPFREIQFSNHYHDFKLIDGGNSPTCEKPQVKKYICDCGATRTETASAYGHKIIPATCTSAAYCQHGIDDPDINHAGPDGIKCEYGPGGVIPNHPALGHLWQGQRWAYEDLKKKQRCIPIYCEDPNCPINGPIVDALPNNQGHSWIMRNGVEVCEYCGQIKEADRKENLSFDKSSFLSGLVSGLSTKHYL